MRSYPPFDVAAICAMMNGGGHKYAAGCEIVGTKRQVRDEILKHVRKALED
jgi:nanoRNase/pAp phosphatase (c-di-AMP/oligoRNAs hydrolase)